MMDEFSALISRRTRLRHALLETRQVKEDIARYGAEGAQAALHAALWASIMMVTDILKIGMSAGDKKAAAGFRAIDTLTDKADKLLQSFGSKPMVKKEDLMRQVDPNLQNAAIVMGYIRKTRAVISKAADDAKLPGQARETYKQLDLVAKLGIAMADDTILLMQAGQLQSQSSSAANHAIAAIDRKLSELVRKIAEIDRLIDGLIQRASRSPKPV
jgi:hypothetical protein